MTRPNNAPNKVDWVVTSSGGAPKIIDVVAEGTSLRLTQRSDYAAFLSRNNNNVGALIEALVAAGHGEDEGITCASDSLNFSKRIDYCYVSASLRPKIRSAQIDDKAVASDHQPIWTELDL